MPWRNWEFDHCPYCGNIAEIETEAEEGFAIDGDNARCVECGCPGSITVEDDLHAFINWHDEPNCECDWCKSHPV